MFKYILLVFFAHLSTICCVKSKEDFKKFLLLNQTREYVNRHNINAQHGRVSFKLKLNDDSFLSDDEYFRYRTGAFSISNSRRFQPQMSIPIIVKNALQTNVLPLSIDWRKVGIVGPVRNQGYCGSCWAFAVALSIESHVAKRNSFEHLEALSAQLLLDCTTLNRGCNGGFMENAFEYAMQNGMVYNFNYPYVGHRTSCRYNPTQRVANLTSYFKTTSERELQALVANMGPVAVLILSRFTSFRHYSSGIYFEPECNRFTGRYDHAVLVVGYGVENGIDYWLIQNTWGIQWGESGYMKIRRGVSNCGIGTYNLVPIL